MKKMKKLAALFLALVMVLSCMAMTAAAYGEEEHSHECAACCDDEGVMPLYVPDPCPMCGMEASYSPKKIPGTHEYGTWVVCSNVMCGYVGWLNI